MATRLLDRGVDGRRVALLLALVLSGAGCAAPPRPPDAAADDGPGVTSLDADSHSVSGVPAALLEAALDDAARRTSVARADIRVVSAGAVTWPDGSIGCPQPGMLYTQALVPGYRIVLQAGHERVNYHAGRDGRPRFCPAANVQPPIDAAVER